MIFKVLEAFPFASSSCLMSDFSLYLNSLIEYISCYKYKSYQHVTTSNKHCPTGKMHSELSFSISSAVPVVEKGALLNSKAAIP